MNWAEQPKQCWGCLQWGVVVFVIMLLASLLLPTFNVTADISSQTLDANNCRQIIMALKIWASENEGVFPDSSTPLPTSSNQVFRKLIQADIIQDERIFSSTDTPFRPDNIMGNAPDYPRALEPGENHWAMVAGLETDSDGTWPLVFENPVSSQWPPRWLKNQTQAAPGRTWKGGKIIMGRLDNSVTVERLVEKEGVLMTSDAFTKRFGNEPMPHLRILNVEEKK